MRGPVAVVVGGLDQQPAGVGGPALVIEPCRRLVVRGPLARHDPEEPRQQCRLGEPARSRRPPRTAPAAVSVSIPRKQRNRAITGAWRAVGDLLLERADQRPRGGPSSSSTEAR